MIKGILVKVLLGAGLLTIGSPSNHHLCSGFVPENDLSIPMEAALDVFGFTTQGIEKKQFDAVLDRIQAIYGPIIAKKGGTLQFSRKWSSDVVNASAQRLGETYLINMYGGLARHEAITEDGFSLVACHEMGHHIGGFPKNGGFFSNWASNEGQSDYFSTLKCLRRIWPSEETAEVVESLEIPAIVSELCEQVWNETDERNLCKRLSLAGYSVSSLFTELRDAGENPQFHTPDPAVVSSTKNKHPMSQCRLDTYFQGALCNKDIDDSLSDTDAAPGACVRSAGDSIGIRPLCWYAP